MTDKEFLGETHRTITLREGGFQIHMLFQHEGQTYGTTMEGHNDILNHSIFKRMVADAAEQLGKKAVEAGAAGDAQ